MAARTPRITHFVQRNGGTVLPLCGDWDYATNWTTDPSATSCRHCIARLAERAGAQRREREASGKATLSIVPPGNGD